MSRPELENQPFHAEIRRLGQGVLAGLTTGLSIPFLAFGGEWLNGATSWSLFTTPTVALVATACTPIIGAVVGALIGRRVHQLENDRHLVAARASDLADEVWELSEALSTRPFSAETGGQPEYQSDELLLAQTLIIQSFGDSVLTATAAIDMDLRSFEYTKLDRLQVQILGAMKAHLQEIEALAAEVTNYSSAYAVPEAAAQPADQLA